jgi:hypothetical protein
MLVLANVQPRPNPQTDSGLISSSGSSSSSSSGGSSSGKKEFPYDYGNYEDIGSGTKVKKFCFKNRNCILVGRCKKNQFTKMSNGNFFFMHISLYTNLTIQYVDLS